MAKKSLKIYAFIDSQNLNLSIRSCGWKLDFARFRVYLYEKYSVEKAFIFIGYKEGNERLYDSLHSAGFTLIFKPTLTYKDKNTKGNVDAELVLHTIINIKRYSGAVIVSGDGDFYCLVEYLLSKQKLHKLLIPNQQIYSALLRHFDSRYIAFVSELKNKLAYKKKEPQTDQPVKGAPRHDYVHSIKGTNRSQ